MMRGSTLAIGLIVGVLSSGCDEADSGRVPAARLSLSETLAGGDTAGYERAREVRRFSFPRDHGAHPGFRTEWWYVTGNLETEAGRPFGFQLTIFRSALSPTEPSLASAWATNQAYMGHFTVTDVEGGRFHAFERFARGGAGLAGARMVAARDTSAALRVWVEDWSLTGSAGGSGFPMRASAEDSGVAIDLRLEAGKPVVLQGDRGLSRKGPEPGNASYYYAHTRMPASGSLVVEGDTVAVDGLAWMDREWSTSALSGEQVGWDWFALQLDDGWDVMVYQLRLADGRPDPLSDGVLIDPEGEKTRLAWDDELTLEVTEHWTSPIDGTRYPSGWRLSAPNRGLDLTVEPVLDDQELDLAFRYWEGAVRVRGTGVGGRPVEGRGYVELTGYAGDVRDR
ncbi:MAG: lipocalin-like domain-containing protein [Gemmatimonadota bacterium]|nr:lipocalin-like domain-containing protein [Gemmatimonadota bacterium]